MEQKIALLQMDVAHGDPKINFARVSKWVMEAAYTGVDVVVLPELWDTGLDLANLSGISDRDARATSEFLSDLAKQYRIAIVGGSMAEETETGIYNTMLIINQTGDLVHKYSKQNLQQETDEQSYFTVGKASFSFTLNGISSAGLISDDVNLLTENQKLADPVSVVYIVAAWNEQTIKQSHDALQTYAGKNSCYVIVCNRTGSDPNNEFAGMSCVIGPDGNINAESSPDEKMIMTTIDLTPVNNAKN